MAATADNSSEQPMEVEDSETGQQQLLASPSNVVEAPVCGEVVGPLVPAPKHITEVEYKVLSSCLTRYVIILLDLYFFLLFYLRPTYFFNLFFTVPYCSSGIK